MISSPAVFWAQSRALAVANLKCRYRKTVAGFLWVILNPMIAFSVQAVAFGYFLKIDVEHYLLFLVAGLLPWMFIAQTLEMSTTVIVNSGSLIKSILVSPVVFIFAQLLDNLVNFLITFAAILLAVLLFENAQHWALLLLPLPLISLVMGVFALSWLTSTAQIFFRDTRFLVTFALQISFFLTPIFYPKEFIVPEWRWLISFNPFFHLIAPFQILIHDFNWHLFVLAMTDSLIASGLLLFAATLVWRRQRPKIYLHV